MPYYFIAQIKINNETEYQKYLDRAESIFKKHQGTYLSVDDKPLILEGLWNYTRAVIIKFEAKKDFDDWYHSDEYQEILKYRLAAAQCDTILLKGNDG